MGWFLGFTSFTGFCHGCKPPCQKLMKRFQHSAVALFAGTLSSGRSSKFVVVLSLGTAPASGKIHGTLSCTKREDKQLVN